MDTYNSIAKSFKASPEHCLNTLPETETSSQGYNKLQQMCSTREQVHSHEFATEEQMHSHEFATEEQLHSHEFTGNTTDNLGVNDVSYRTVFTPEDVQDGFLKWIRGCGGSKSKLLDEDTETYGFDDLEKREKTIVGRFKRRLSERRSRRSKHHQARIQRSKSQDDINRTSRSIRQNSYKEAVNVYNENVPYNDSVGITSANIDVPSDTNVSNERNKNSYGPYPNQTNAQSHPKIKYRKKYEPIIDPDVYTFNNPERGYLVNIVNDRFIQQPSREGAGWDLMKMKEIGRKFGFRLFNYERDRNLTQRQMLNLLTEVQALDHSKCDCFMFMISTHGLEQRNPAIGGKLDHALVCADDRLVFTSTILNMFNDTNCPTLAGKPKIFFIQACRGEQIDHGSDVFVVHPARTVDRPDETVSHGAAYRARKQRESVDEFDTRPGADSWANQYGTGHVQYTSRNPAHLTHDRNQTTSLQTESLAIPPRPPTPQFYAPIPNTNSLRNNYTVAKIPFNPQPLPADNTPSLQCSNDMLVMYAIPQGMFAWRSQSDGSWMINYLHQILMSHNMAAPKNFLSLLTKVSAIMAERSTNTPTNPKLDKKKAIPVIENKLVKDIIFQPKVHGSNWIKQFQHMAL